ncbi:transcription factor EB isoform X2 [Parasteatoda tepidariorum]|uniref:transcription factor EB isoform X2 n=2 Tax=Parasteatoda tepidariorum TaxID=114398 RepID=UPI00077FCFFE|nr:transcription factor EB isoform X2 [Parasteatoda tepidariorum]
MPSCDIITPDSSSSFSAIETPPTRRRPTVVPATALLTVFRDKNSNCIPHIKTTTPDSKRPLIKCIVKVLKRSKSEEDNNNEGSKKPREDFKEVKQVNKKHIIKLPIMISRTNLKQQLMREEMLQREKKEREISCSAPTQTSIAIRVPHYIPPRVPVQLPRQEYKSKLENPTAYHVEKSQQRQFQEYIFQSHHGKKSNSLPTQHIANSVEPSPVSDFSTAVSSNAPSPTELDEFWNDFESYNRSCTDSVADNFLDPSLTVPVAAPADPALLDMLSTMLPLDPVSTSCPAELAEVISDGELLTEEKVQAIQKDRQKKDNHNRIERKRRFNINDRIKELSTLLPGCNDKYYELVKDIRQNKGTILKASVDYVRCLKKEVQKIPDLEMRLRVVEQTNKKLLLHIHNLELQLKANNIPIQKSTWYPSTEEEIQSLIKQEPIPYSPLTHSSNEKYFISSQPNLAPLPEHCSSDFQNFDPLALRFPHSDPNGTRRRVPNIQFLNVKKESQSHTSSSSCSQSPATCYASSPAPSYSPFEDLMMEDDQPVTGDPMLSSRDSMTPEHMDFMS